MTNEYYKQDLCNSESSCKLYNPLATQGQCEYYNQWCELKKELEVYKRALKRCFTCGAGFIDGLYERALAEARKELEEKDVKN